MPLSLTERDRLAAAIVEGDAGPAIAACGGDTVLSRKLSHAAARLLIARASSHESAVDVSEAAWPVAQLAIAAFAAVPGADAQRLAEALLECCLLEPVSGEPDQLEDAALRFVLHHCTPELEELFDLPFDPEVPEALVPPWSPYLEVQSRFVVDAMWILPGPEGVRWMRRLLRRNPYAVVSRRPPAWGPDDWILRLDALAEMDGMPSEAHEEVAGAVLNEAHPPPIEASAALVRYACAGLGHDEERTLVRRAAAIVGGYRTGDPASDVRLFWWDATGEAQLETLRWMIELSGPAGERRALVDAAVAGGLVDATAAASLAAPLERPSWAGGDVA